MTIRHIQFLLLSSLFLFISDGYADNLMSKIPHKIWQTYKTKKLPQPALEAQQTWLNQNPGYKYHLWDDDDIEAYIKNNWSSDMYRFFKELPLGVMKADLWRYLIITTEGGIYSDIDSVCCTPIQYWTPNTDSNNKHILLLGLANDYHLCQWTIAATPNHPALKYLCEHILKKWKRKGIDVTRTHFVGMTTGPGIWTRGIKAYLGIDSLESPRDIFIRYQQDEVFKKNVNKKGVFLYSKGFYSGEVTRNLFGSVNFGDGYKNWVEEGKELTKKLSKKKR